MRVTKVATTRACAVCERTLLMGERAVSFAPSEGAELVDVCPLCQELAIEAGWIKEGAPTTPTLENGRRRRRKRRRRHLVGVIVGKGDPCGVCAVNLHRRLACRIDRQLEDLVGAIADAQESTGDLGQRLVHHTVRDHADESRGTRTGPRDRFDGRGNFLDINARG